MSNVGLVWSDADFTPNYQVSAWKSQQFQCGNNCACESGIATQPNPSYLTTFPPTQASQLRPRQRSELYLKECGSYLAAYNPNGRFGVAVLNSFAREVFNLLRGSYTLAEISSLLEQPLSEIINTTQLLERAELIYTNEQEPDIHFSQSNNVAVWMHVTNQCNLRCTYCYVEKTSQKMSSRTGRQALDEIFATTLKHGRHEILLKFAGGEALTVFPLVRELTNYARELGERHNIKVVPVILTNGTPINPQIAQIMHDEDYVAALSLDGLAEYNDITRPLLGGQGSFDKIERGINLLLEYGVRLNVSVVVSKYNLQHLPTLTSYLLERDLSFTFNFFRENELADNSLGVENEQLVDWLEQAYDVIAQVNPSYSLMNAILDRVQFNSPHLQACGAGTNYIVVKHTGEIVGCQMHMQKTSIGRLGQNSDLLELVQKRNFISPAGRSSDLKEGCSTCQWRYVCAGGCPIMTFASRGRFDSRSPFCSAYKQLIPRVLDLEAGRIIKYAASVS